MIGLDAGSMLQICLRYEREQMTDPEAPYFPMKSVKMTERDSARLDDLKLWMGLTSYSDVIRALIRAEHKRLAEERGS